MFAPPTTESNSNSIIGVQDPTQLGPTPPLPLTSSHVPTGILIVVMLLNGSIVVCLFEFILFLFLPQRPILQILVEHPLTAKFVPGLATIVSVF